MTTTQLSRPVAAALVAAAIAVGCGGSPEPDETAAAPDDGPLLVALAEPAFADAGAQPNAFADFDGDGDLDLFVGFRGRPNRLYRNDGGRLTDVAPDAGLADGYDTRAAAWGDYDADGHLDLYVGFPAAEEVGNRLYRGTGDGRFTDVAHWYGLDLVGNTRQASWIDYDNDGDLDLFVAFREQRNRLFRNDGDGFTDVSEATGIDDPRRTVGVAWLDLDADGDLDAFVANQNGDADGVFVNEVASTGRFVDRAGAMGMDGGARTEEYGGVGPAVADYDADGDLDLFVAVYGPDLLYRNDGGGTFTEVGAGTAIAEDYHSTSAAWGDVDNDGWPDLYVVSYLRDAAEAPDHLFENRGGTFTDVTPAAVLERGGSHGVQWADFDGDGDVDLALANNHPDAGHPLYENRLPPERARRSVRVRVRDAAGGAGTLPGAEVRLYAAGSERVLGAALVDSGGGYCSQSVMPVHFGLGDGVDRVDVALTYLTSEGRRTVRVPDVPAGSLTEIGPER